MAADLCDRFFATILKNDRPTRACFSWRAIQRYNEADDATRKRGHQLRTAGFETKGKDDASEHELGAVLYVAPCSLIEERSCESDSCIWGESVSFATAECIDEEYNWLLRKFIDETNSGKLKKKKKIVSVTRSFLRTFQFMELINAVFERLIRTTFLQIFLSKQILQLADTE